MSVTLDHRDAVEAELRTSTAQLVAVFFLLAFGYVIGQAAGYALFVERFGAADLPLALLLMPVFGAVLTTISLRAARSMGLSRLLLAQTAAMVGLAVGVRVGLLGGGSTVLRFLLPMWDAGINNLSNLVVWSAASRLFDVRQVKRLAPIVAGGRSAALIVGGACTPAIVGAVGTSNLYAVQAGVFAAALVVLATLVRRRQEDLGRATPKRPGGHRRSRFAPPDRRYVGGVFAVVLLSMTAYVLVRTVFLDRGAAALPDPAEYAGRIGVVSSIQGAVTLLAGLLLGGRFLRRFGLLGGAVALPAVVLAAYVPFVALLPGLDLQLWIASLAYVAASAAMYGVRTPTIQVFYQPLPDADRARAVSIGEGIVEPTALGLAALILLVVTRVTDWGARGMGAMIVVVAGALIVVGIGAGRRYRPALERALANRWLRSSTAVLADGDSRRWLVDEAMRGDLDDVAAIVALFESGDDAAPLVERLVDHPDREVRSFALQWLLDSERLPSADIARRIVADDPSIAVRALAARLGGRSGDVDAATEALGGEDPAIRLAALIGLLESNSTEASAVADLRLAEWTAERRSIRAAAAAALRIAGSARHEQIVAALLDDPDPAVRSDALGAAGRIATPGLVAPIVAAACSGDRSVAARAIAALGANGAAALGALDEALDHSDDPVVCRRLGRAIGRIDGPAADASRRRLLEHPDAALRARAAVDLLGRSVRLDADEIATLVSGEVARAGAVLAARFADDDGRPTSPAAAELLTISLDDSLDTTGSQLLRLLALDRREIVSTNVIRGLDSPDQRRRAYALEALDGALPNSLKPLVIPFVNAAIGPAAVLSRRPSGGRNVDAPIDPLATIAAGPDPWLARLARHLHRPVEAAPIDQDGATMTLLIERIVLLRRVDAFAELPAEMLAGVAELLVEVDLADGERLFEEGDLGTSMYVVAEGAIRIHHAHTDVDRLGRYDAFGELALLDSEPRSASATADGASRLFRLDAEPFFELVGDHPEVYRGIVRTLVRRVRALTTMIGDQSS